MTDLSEFESLDETEELRKVNAELQRKLKQAKRKTADLVEAVFQGAREAALIQGKPPAVPAPRPSRSRKRPEAAMLVLSDWHVGKHTSSFNSDVAADRIRLLARKTAKIAEIERADHPVRECHALAGGDMVDNTSIFPGHAYEVDSTLFQQVFRCAGILTELTRHLLSTFETVHLWEQTGNHGRLGKKGDYPRSDNVDRLVYRLAHEQLSGEKRLVWHPAESWYTIVGIGSYQALLIHGDQIKSFGGNTPAFGIARKANAWATGVLPPFTDVLMGHFHQPLVVPLANGAGRVFVNPSIESDSSYAKEFVAATGTPGQRLFFVDPERGRITSERILWLDA